MLDDYILGMLISFRTQNHRSLKDEQTLTLASSSGLGDDSTALSTVEHLEAALLPVAAIYGANASGKSNLFHALSFALRAILVSQRQWEPEEPIPRDPFLLAGLTDDPSVYVFDFVSEGARHQYGFAVDDHQVLEEWLHAWPNGRRQVLFQRERQEFEFSRGFTGENKTIEALTRKNSLFISAAAQNNHERILPLYRWFASGVRIVRLDATFAPRAGVSGWWSQFGDDINLEPHIDRKGKVQALLRSADLGIVDFRVEEEEERLIGPRGEPSVFHRRTLLLRHQTGKDSEAWLGLAQESTGTTALIRMIPALVEVLENGGVLVIDELNSLHPILAMEIVRLFQVAARNPKRAQLLFNTHDVTLLGTLVDEPRLRRDQIWFTEKDDSGASHIYSLSDYHPRSSENVERGYLQGRYGAVPFLGSFGWSTSTSTEDDGSVPR